MSAGRVSLAPGVRDEELERLVRLPPRADSDAVLFCNSFGPLPLTLMGTPSEERCVLSREYPLPETKSDPVEVFKCGF